MRMLLGLLVSLGLVSAAHAAPGDLDTTFSGDGLLVETSLAPSVANAVAIQPDGRIVVVGSTNAGPDFVVLRYNRNGTRDTTFGGNGLVVTPFGTAVSEDVATAVALQSDGRIVVVGRVGSSTNPKVGGVRYNADGSRDTTFGVQGRFEMEFGNVTAGGGASAVAVRADGKIIVVGSNGADFAAARINANGTLDTTFGLPPTPAGFVTRDMGAGASEGASTVAILPDGRILMAGTARFNGRDVFAFTTVSGDGQIQETLGPGIGNGAQHTSFGNSDARVEAMAIQPDGKIVLVGSVTVTGGGGSLPIFTDTGLGIARYNPDGTMDATFGSAGLVTIDFGGTLIQNAFARGVALQRDGKIVVVGRVNPETGFRTNFVVVRLNPSGSFDLTWNGNGRLVTDFDANLTDAANAVAVQPADGRIVVAGSSGDRIALARYHAMSCNGRDVTILGTNGAETINGTAGDDVIHGLDGNDTIDGGDGNDTICGGDGADVLRGSGGNDTLNAGLGADSMNGGLRGRDTCLGSNLGPVFDPPDTFFDCETATTGGAGVSGEWLELEEHCNGSARNPQCRLAGRFRVFNPGTESTLVRSTVAFYLSDDAVLDDGDTFLTTESVAALAAGGDDVVKLNIRLGGSAAGRFVIGVVDAFNDVPERNETNNVAVSPPVSARRNGKGH